MCVFIHIFIAGVTIAIEKDSVIQKYETDKDSYMFTTNFDGIVLSICSLNFQ